MSSMRLTSVSVTNFLALPNLCLEVDRDLTVITGANGIGKSTVLAACSLAKDAVSAAADGDVMQLEARWADASRDAGATFEVRVGLRFDHPDECTLLDHYVVAALLPLLHSTTGSTPVQRADEVLTEVLGASPAHALTQGTLVIRFDASQRQRWLVGWEFELSGSVAHLGLLGLTAGELADGSVRFEPAHRRRSQLVGQTNDILAKLQAGKIPVKLDEILDSDALEFRVQPTGERREPPSVQAVLSACKRSVYRSNDHVMFSGVFDALFTSRLLVTPNHRERPRSAFRPEDLISAPDLADGSMLAVELHRLKNGDAAAREQFARIQERLAALTGETVDCQQTTTSDNGSEAMIHLTPVLQRRRDDGTNFDVALHRAGAGLVEALYLSTVLAGDRHVVLLDEPAVHLSPTAQRRLLALLRSQDHAGQVVMVTHNPDVVPVRDAQDLGAIVRLSRSNGQVRAQHLPKETLEQPDKTIQQLASPGLRSVLFAAGVVLCEGDTDLALLRSWTDRKMTSNGAVLPTSEDQNVVFFAVNGQNGFPSTIRLLRCMGIPWVVVADGPALRPGGRLAKYLRAEELLESMPPAQRLEDVREVWAEAGVYSFATEFGDDGSKSGEIEAFMESIDPEALETARKAVGAQKGARVGAAFAAAVAPPPVVADLWALICHRLIDADR